MEKVVFEENQLSSWLEYINLKFENVNYFEVNNDNENYILIKSKTNNTKIWFYEYDEINQTILDCQYSNDDCKSWSGETCAVDYEKFGKFNQENLNMIDEILDTPIYKGWYSEDFYIGNELYKANSYSDKNKSKRILTYSSGCMMGCLNMLFFPFSKVIEFFMKNGIFGRCEKITIGPIIK